LPSKRAAEGAGDAGQFTVECAICYAYELNGEPPSKACDNPKCAQPFHTVCLGEVRGAHDRPTGLVPR